MKQEKEKIVSLMNELNGQSASNLKLITISIQEMDILKFNAECEKILLQTNPETISYYSIQNLPMNVGNGFAMLNILTVQIWVDDSEFKEWEQKIKLNSLIVKP